MGLFAERLGGVQKYTLVGAYVAFFIFGDSGVQILLCIL